MSVGEAKESARFGLKERLLAGGALSIERLPLLRAVFLEMASRFEDSLRGIADPSAKLAVVEIAAARGQDVFERFEHCALTAVYDSAEPDAKIIAGADQEFIFSLLEALFGGDGSEPQREEPRGLSTVEARIGQFALGRLTRALKESFASVADVPFVIEQPLDKTDFVLAGRKSASAMICRCRLGAFDREGELLIAVPHALLDPLRETLSRDPLAEAPLLDPEWAKRMQDRVSQTEVSIHAVLEKPELTLADIARFEVGQIVELPISPTSLIKLECEGEALFWCELGQKDGVYTIRIEDLVDERQEFIDDVLGG